LVVDNQSVDASSSHLLTTEYALKSATRYEWLPVNSNVLCWIEGLYFAAVNSLTVLYWQPKQTVMITNLHSQLSHMLTDN